MISEDYVSFEVAKLLKEKGFNETTQKWYLKYKGKYSLVSKGSAEHPDDSIDVPTLQMTMKWLREVHQLVVEPYYYFALGGWCVDIKHLEKCTELEEFENIREKSYNTYEEACEAAIKYCLENLI